MESEMAVRPWRFNAPFLNSSPFVLIRVSVFAVTMGGGSDTLA